MSDDQKKTPTLADIGVPIAGKEQLDAFQRHNDLARAVVAPGPKPVLPSNTNVAATITHALIMRYEGDVDVAFAVAVYREVMEALEKG